MGRAIWAMHRKVRRQMDKITPRDFEDRMRQIAKNPDPEARHHEADCLMMDVLAQHGYENGLDVYEDMVRWYA